MIFVTGDIHGDPFSRLSADAFPEQKRMSKEDFVIICGDFGCIWDGYESARERYALNWLSEKPFTTLFVDGNHENHDRLDSMPVSVWHGGKAHFLRDNVIHLMRGQYYEDVCGKSVFSFGGARSHDIWNLLDPDDPDYKSKRRSLVRKNEFFRVKGISWWEREMPDEKEMQEGLDNLSEHGNRVDFIITHEAPEAVFRMFYSNRAGGSDSDPLRDYLNVIRKTVSYGAWFFGHHHGNAKVTDKDILLYEQIVLVS